jgi:adenylate cyclase
MATAFPPHQSDPAGNPLIRWLMSEGWWLPTPEALTAALGGAINAAGIPLLRLRVSLRLLHPQFIGVSYTWRRNRGDVEVFRPPHEILIEDTYLRSPLAAIYEGAGAIRRRLTGAGALRDYPVLDELAAEGATDYVAMPLIFTDGRRCALTIASDRDAGFTASGLTCVYDALPAIAHAFEVHALRATASNILDTFLGRASGERVLKGLIRRGDAETIHAVLWYSDLRGSTRLADSLPQQTYLALLNDYFDCTAGAVLSRGGQVLSFIGDAVFAIFPTDDVAPCPGATAARCSAAVDAARQALVRLSELNRRRAAAGAAAIGFGVALHLGEVSYGNIGVPERLDFTVIGAAANEVARLAQLCRTLERPILISDALAATLPERFVSLGCHVLRGVREPREVFTLADPPAPAEVPASAPAAQTG